MLGGSDMPKIGFTIALMGAVLFVVNAASAQDIHYWTHQYGTRSNLLGGAVVGSVLDLSGTYYNPGGLSLIDPDAVELLMFAKVFHYPSFTIQGIGDSQGSLSDRRLGEAPTLVAGSLPLKGLGDHWLGYSYLNRNDTKFELSDAWIGIFPPSGIFEANAPGAVDLRLYEKMYEPWFGLTWAYKISERFGIGITNYLTFRNHWVIYRSSFQFLDTEGRVHLASDLQEYRYDFVGLLWKIGLAYDLDRITLGVTLTTPRLKILGKGEVGQNTTVIRHDPDHPDFMAVDSQEGLKATYKSPISVAAGVTYKLKTTSLYVTLQWFGGVGEYVVIEGEDFTSQSGGKQLPSKVTHKVDSVLNFALGVEQRLSRKFTLYGSFWTDYSARKGQTTTNLSVADFNLYHTMVGTTFTAFGSQFSLGMGYAFGHNIQDNRQVQVDPTLRDIARAYFSDLKYSYSNVKLVIGFSF